jgi:hypothetical protein
MYSQVKTDLHRSVWKPLNHPVYDCPLAVCDGSTIRNSDLILCDNVTKAKIAELMLPLYNPDASWHYLSEQKPNEVTIMKIVDSATDVVAPCCPHSAFDLKDFDQSSPPRRSIEMRALVYTKPENMKGLTKADVKEAVQEIERIVMERIDATEEAVEKAKILMEVQVEPEIAASA